LRISAARPTFSWISLVDVGQLQREGHVVEHAHVRVQRVALEHHRQVALGRGQPGDVAPVEFDRAAVDFGEARDHAQQRRLAAARGPDEDDELALLDLQVTPLMARRLPKTFRRP
jgi:hypothetical protein